MKTKNELNYNEFGNDNWNAKKT